MIIFYIYINNKNDNITWTKGGCTGCGCLPSRDCSGADTCRRRPSKRGRSSVQPFRLSLEPTPARKENCHFLTEDGPPLIWIFWPLQRTSTSTEEPTRLLLQGNLHNSPPIHGLSPCSLPLIENPLLQPAFNPSSFPPHTHPTITTNPALTPHTPETILHNPQPFSPNITPASLLTSSPNHSPSHLPYNIVALTKNDHHHSPPHTACIHPSLTQSHITFIPASTASPTSPQSSPLSPQVRLDAGRHLGRPLS